MRFPVVQMITWLGHVVDIVRDNVQKQANTTLEEAAHLGIQPTGNRYNDVVADESRFLELMAYRMFPSPET